MEEGGRILEGITVVELGSFIAGPAAATVMTDFGAEVIKIEPPEGDPYRALHRSPGNPVCEIDYALAVDARNKQSIALDLKRPEARAVLERLVARADVFVTNQPKDVRDRLRIRYEDLRPLNERLVYASLTAYGEVGDEAGRTGFDSTAWWARSGLMDLARSTPDAPPARSLPGMGDHPTAISLFAGILLALLRRERTGKGGMVSTSLMANGVWSNAVLAQAMLMGAPFTPRPPREQARTALNNLYECRDGRWFMLVVINEAKQWERIATALGRRDLIDDPRFAEMKDRHANARLLTRELDAVFAQKDWAEWKPILQSNDITFGEIARLSDLPEDRQMIHNEALVPGPYGALTVNSPIFVSGEAKRPPGRYPEVGEHTEAVLRRFGYDDAALAGLRSAGVIR
jgi:crotonobetainyl-CoA:carnitine CoA-transferase CaiB-like acyl-CoA transferase